MVHLSTWRATIAVVCLLGSMSAALAQPKTWPADKVDFRRIPADCPIDVATVLQRVRGTPVIAQVRSTVKTAARLKVTLRVTFRVIGAPPATRDATVLLSAGETREANIGAPVGDVDTTSPIFVTTTACQWPH